MAKPGDKSIDAYRDKRDFRRTPEPPPEAPAERDLNFHHPKLGAEPEKDVDAESGTVTYTWTRRNIEKLESEPGMPLAPEVSPMLEISTFKDWRAFSTWYWNLVRKQFESSPEIRRKVRELTSGAEDDLAKIRAVYNFVVTDIRYNTWVFGVHGFKPYNAASIFARKFGLSIAKVISLSELLTPEKLQPS